MMTEVGDQITTPFTLPRGWAVRKTNKNRLYYINHHTQTSHWLPPEDCWLTDKNGGLPYGWEEACDKTKKNYFINHVNRLTTTDDPRDDLDDVTIMPAARQVDLHRDTQLGFGFVAGSEKPVIVRCVTEGGPSEERLLAGDQILEINGEDVRKAPREYVIELVRSCKSSINLTVCQPCTDNSSRKSAILTAAKKARLKNNPNRVHFSEAITVNGDTVQNPSDNESYLPFLPNVLKVFLENGQTKSFKYDTTTNVRDVLCSLQEKLAISRLEHFALVLHDMKSPNPAQISYLREEELLSEIAARPGSQHFKCTFRLAFVPDDPEQVLRRDPVAFEYFFIQCCNDVVSGKYSSELKHETAIRLAALHMYQHALSGGNTTGKISLKAIEKECGLDAFMSRSLLDSTKTKDLRKMITHYIKNNLSNSGINRLSELEAKLGYVDLVSELRLYGSRCFMVTVVDKKTDSMILVGPRYGISAVTSIKNNACTMLTNFAEIDHIVISKDGSDTMHRIQIKKLKPKPVWGLLMMTEDVGDFMALVEGYYRLLTDSDRDIFLIVSDGLDSNRNGIPSYHDVHNVVPVSWSYVGDDDVTNDNLGSREHLLDLTSGPPSYKEHNGLDNEYEDSQIVTDSSLHESEFKDEEAVNLGVRDAPVSIYESVVSGTGTLCDTMRQLYTPTGADHDDDSVSITTPDTVTMATWHANIEGSDQLCRLGVADDLTSESDSLSDTFTNDSHPLLHSYMADPGLYLEQGGSMQAYLMSESDDTDSYSTPTDSPCKIRANSLDLVPPKLFNERVTDRPHSFGLRSPDALPRSERDYHMIAKSFGLHSPDQFEYMDAEFRSRLLEETQLYFDKDLIDLTMIPPPKTPDTDLLIDFTTMALPPPEFSDDITLSDVIGGKGAVGGTAAHVGGTRNLLGARILSLEQNGCGGDPDQPEPEKESESDSGNETISSENIDFTSDYLLSQDPDGQHVHDDVLLEHLESLRRVDLPSSASWSSMTRWSSTTGNRHLAFIDQSQRASIEAQIAALVVPPPPVEVPLSHIPIVPPVQKLLRSKSTDVSMSLSRDVSVGVSRDVSMSLSRKVSVSVSRDVSVDESRDVSMSLSRDVSVSESRDVSVGVSRDVSVSESRDVLHRSSSSDLDQIPSDEKSSSSSIDSVKRSPRTCSHKTWYSDKMYLDLDGRDQMTDGTVGVAVNPDGHQMAPPEKHVSDAQFYIEPSGEFRCVSSVTRDSLPDTQDSLPFTRDSLPVSRVSDRDQDSAISESEVESRREVTEVYFSSGSGTVTEPFPNVCSPSAPTCAPMGRASRARNRSSDLRKRVLQTQTNQQRPTWLFGVRTLSEDRASDSRNSSGIRCLDPRRSSRDTRTMSEDRSHSLAGLPLVRRCASDDRQLQNTNLGEERRERALSVLTLTYPLQAQYARRLVLDRAASLDMATDNGGALNDLSILELGSHSQSSDSNICVRAPTKVFLRTQSDNDAINGIRTNASNAGNARRSCSTDRELGNFPRAQEYCTSDSNLCLRRKETADSSNDSADVTIARMNSDDVITRKDNDMHEVDNFRSLHNLTSDPVVKTMLGRDYNHGNVFEVAANDVKTLTVALKSRLNDRVSVDEFPRRPFRLLRESLVFESRQFVADSKLLVSSATQSSDQVREQVQTSSQTLAKIVNFTLLTVSGMASTDHVTTLITRVVRVCEAYQATMMAAEKAAGHKMDHSDMKCLMRHATTLATVLSALMKTLRALTDA